MSFAALRVCGVLVVIDNSSEQLEEHLGICREESLMMLWRTIDAGLAEVRQVDSSGNLITRCPIDRMSRTPALAAPQLNLAFVSLRRMCKSEYDIQERVRSE